VCIEIDVERVPRVAGVSALQAASSGEEYEIAVTGPAMNTAQFSQEFGLDLTEIGRVVPGTPGIVLKEGGELIATPPGFDHFRDK
jgi:thiamine monophosphate kinase